MTLLYTSSPIYPASPIRVSQTRENLACLVFKVHGILFCDNYLFYNDDLSTISPSINSARWNTVRVVHQFICDIEYSSKAYRINANFRATVRWTQAFYSLTFYSQMSDKKNRLLRSRHLCSHLIRYFGSSSEFLLPFSEVSPHSGQSTVVVLNGCSTLSQYE